jgi:hypothetical protein
MAALELLFPKLPEGRGCGIIFGKRVALALRPINL